MPLTAFQRGVCKLIAANRVKSGESYVAGGVALSELTNASRLSRDIDIFHDTRRASHYTQEDIAGLSFEDAPPNLADLSVKWRLASQQAQVVVDLLPENHVGECVLDQKGALFRGEPNELKQALRNDSLQFHKGHIGGSMPVFCDMLDKK